MTDPTRLRADAEKILRANDRGGYTVPAPSLYPHQWNWDSAFCAIGWSHLDPQRAARELEMLVRGQWADGMIPHIVFNPAAEHYEPGPKAWRTQNAPGAPKDVRTSSITQPPVAATAARIVYERAHGDTNVEQTIRALIPAFERWHAWFLETRDPLGDGVPCIVHPWESGMDNAPRWDGALKRIVPGDVTYRRVDDKLIDASERPTRYDYDRYYYLVYERARLGFAPPRRETEPFMLQDVALASILGRAEEDLAALASELGVESRAAERRARIMRGLSEKLFDTDRKCYCDYDLLSNERVSIDHVAGLLPVYAGAAWPAAFRLQDGYRTDWPVPTVPAHDPHFESHRYWRGPVWVNVNWMLIDGLQRAGYEALSDELSERTIELVARSGFREYFDPMTGEGLGADGFAWTAALVIDLLAR